MQQFVIIAEHAPEFCPTSNAKIREMMKQGAKEIPDLAKPRGRDHYLERLRTRAPSAGSG
jgi:hypothetical protein